MAENFPSSGTEVLENPFCRVMNLPLSSWAKRTLADCDLEGSR